MKRLILNRDKDAARIVADAVSDEWQLAYSCFLAGVLHARRLEREGAVLGRPPRRDADWGYHASGTM